MIDTAPKPDMLLADFVETYYRPLANPGAGATTRKHSKNAIAALSRAVGRTAKLRDLTPENVAKMEQQINGSPLSRSKRGKCQYAPYLVAWGRFAFKMRLANTPFPHRWRVDPYRDDRNRDDGTALLESKHLRWVFERLYMPLRLLDAAPISIRHHRWGLDHFDKFLGRPATLADLADENIAALMASLRETHSPYTINKLRDVLCAQWTFARNRGLVQTGPTVKLMVEPERTPIALTLEEIERALQAARETPGIIDGNAAGDFWLALFLCLFDSGERISCVLAWKWEFLDEATGELDCPGYLRKGRRKAKTYKLRPATLEALAKLHRRDAVIFPWSVDVPTRYYHLRKLMKRAGFPEGRDWCFHLWRKSHASHLLNAGGNPVASLGHSNARLVEKSYLSPRVVKVDHHSDKLPAIGKGGGV